MTMTAERPAIGPRLRALRKAANMTQQQLAEAAGLSISVVTQIEQGKTPDPRISTLWDLARALGVSIDQLAGE
jgi:transcriptional regulator with XRE-family HTH domain